MLWLHANGMSVLCATLLQVCRVCVFTFGAYMFLVLYVLHIQFADVCGV